jgi:type II secretory pathway predicted ATPase ExeA
MTIILIGQPELIKKVKEIEQLDQRIAIKYHLTPFNLEETARYIIFRQERREEGATCFLMMQWKGYMNIQAGYQKDQ